VSSKLIACFAGDRGFEVVIIEIVEGELNKFGKSIYKFTLNNRVRYGPITNIIYNEDCGIMLTTFGGILMNFEALEFKMVWEYNDNSLSFTDKTTMTVCTYSHKLGYICIGGIEGRISMYDQSAKVKVATAHKHT
jgi:hypothetical protein